MSHPQAGQPCLGRTPGYWKQQQWFDSWPDPFYPTTTPNPGGHSATRFHSQLTGFAQGSGGRQFGSKTMLEVLQTTGGPPGDVGRHVVAALLNAAKGWTLNPTIQSVRAIWNEYAQNDYYEPMAGIHWDHTQIVAYLKSTMPL